MVGNAVELRTDHQQVHLVEFREARIMQHPAPVLAEPLLETRIGLKNNVSRKQPPGPELRLEYRTQAELFGRLKGSRHPVVRFAGPKGDGGFLRGTRKAIGNQRYGIRAHISYSSQILGGVGGAVTPSAPELMRKGDPTMEEGLVG